ncbi:retinol dehydrogenase 7-like isoform X2 [Conger conger]|uniref:retinol dehydrogenase 7-like isoform X2 n=1 Tax=Conger conger TaxID=82655 RepID=UPI002A5B0F4A|nr:retinol dehydrogenase 7-like isoform X2 [Conger conger]
MFLYLLGLVAFIFLYRWNRERKRVGNESDKYVYITGCDSGFGNLLARHLDKLGYRVVASCFTEKGLWAVVNNAGVALPAAPYEWLTLEDFKSMLDVNLFGVIAVVLSILPLIKKARGRVVNMSSVNGRVSVPGGGPYSISKYGVEAFNDGLRRQMLPFGVKVLCIEPGAFKTAILNLDAAERSSKELWDRLPQEIKEDFGSLYLNKLMTLFKQFQPLMDDDLMKVVSCMEHAISAVHPRTRYSAGWDAKFLWLPLSYMPTFITDYLFYRMMVKPEKSVM